MKTLGRLITYMRPYWYVSATSVCLITLLSFARLVPAFMTKRAIDVAIPREDVHLLLGLAALILVVSLATNLVAAFEGYLEQWVGQHVVFDLRKQLYAHLQSQSMSFYDENQTGQLMSRVTNDVQTVQNFLGMGLARLVNTLFTIGMTLLFMLALDARLTLISLVVMPLIVFYQVRMNSIHGIWRRLQQGMADVNAAIQETTAGIKLIKAFGREPFVAERFNAVNWTMRQGRLKATKMMGYIMPGQEFTGNLSQTLILVVGAAFVIRHEMSLGTLVALQSYAIQLWAPVRFIGNINQQAQQASAAGARVFEILDTAVDVVEPPDAIELPRLKGEIAFENVSFAYGKNPPLLRNVDFVAPPGSTVALVGPSGSGKTTLANLIPRFYDPTQGTVRIDGVDIRTVKLESLRSQIGMVMQETFLFNMTIRENIMYGRPDATMDDVVAAAKMANAHDFIVEFPDGYDTLVGERGARLSGGQRQRLAIARAILVDPRILILDEATSAVDTRTDYLITQALQKLMHNRTTIIIAHRLSTVQRADTILVMDRGQIVARGTHRALLQTSEAYRHLYELQFLANRDGAATAASAEPAMVGPANGRHPPSNGAAYPEGRSSPTLEIISGNGSSDRRAREDADAVAAQASSSSHTNGGLA